MKLSEAIAMVAEWLEHEAYNYQIYHAKLTKKGRWKIRFYEYSPWGNIECDTYFYVPNDKRCILNFNNDDVLELGRDANAPFHDDMAWYNEFEKKWRYGDAE